MYTETEKEYMIKAFDRLKGTCIVISPDYKILAANKEAAKTQKSDIIGQLCYSVLHDRSRPCEDCPSAEVKRTLDAAVKTKSEDSEMSDVICLYSYPILSDNKIDALVMLDFKLPIIELLQERLERSDSFLLSLIQSAADGVIATDRKGKILIFNEEAAKISGYSVDEAKKNLTIKDFYYKDGAKDAMQKLRSEEYGGKGVVRAYPIKAQRKNGDVIPISLNAAIVYEDGKEVASIGFFHDMREELKMQKKLEKAQIQLLQSEKMASLGKLAAGVAHQLNNPLGGITLFTKLILEEYDLEEEIKEDLNRILSDAERCRNIVKELLEFSRQTDHKKRPCDINKDILRTLYLLENQTIFHNIDIEKSLDPSLPQIMADVHQLGHVFMNIVINAADAMEGKGKLTVKTYQVPDEDMVCIEIKDTGPGIPDDVLPHIFEPFYTTKDEGKGTGLGLSMVYSIVEDHDGTISVKSKTGEGTTFIIKLPVLKYRTSDK